MSNYVYEHGMFNQELKERYLSSFRDSTQLTARRVFLNSAELERKLDRDLYTFSSEELESILYAMKPTTIGSSRANVSQANCYFVWAIEQGLTDKNPVDQIRIIEDDNWLRRFVVETNSLLNEKELQLIEDWCVNAQDAVIFRLIWEGVYGNGLSELCNLKMSDVDVENCVLNLVDDKENHRQLHVSSRCIELIKDAHNSTIYYKKNGEAVLEDYQREYVDLLDSDYVLKTGKTRVTAYDKVHQHVILRRIRTNIKLFDAGDVTSKSIARSGMIKMAKDALDNGEQLDRDLLEKIGIRFGVNFWWSLRDFVTMETIKKLYPED